VTYAVGALVLALVSCVGFATFTTWNRNRPKDFEARVADVSWERVINVERFQAVAHDGFKENFATDALEVKSLGQREHHQEQVLDHYDTERYSVDVADGYRTETYSERESCGQDCTSTPQSCHESCKSNKNGFATCKTVCSGGGRSCSTRYCDKTKTRQVAKTRSESRTRQVPRYRSEPRYAEAFSWVHWEWLPARTARAAGTDVTTRWPESNLNKGLADGEKERETRREKYQVTLDYGEKRTLTFAPNDELFAKFAPGTKHSIHTEQGTFTLDGAPVTPSR
jgi:hypothetical protein